MSSNNDKVEALKRADTQFRAVTQRLAGKEILQKMFPKSYGKFHSIGPSYPSLPSSRESEPFLDKHFVEHLLVQYVALKQEFCLIVGNKDSMELQQYLDWFVKLAQK